MRCAGPCGAWAHGERAARGASDPPLTPPRATLRGATGEH